MNVRYVITLSPEERATLQALVKGGSRKVRRIKRAQVLLAADAGATDQQILRSHRAFVRSVGLTMDERVNPPPRPTVVRSRVM
jgi:hypothetical protein